MELPNTPAYTYKDTHIHTHTHKSPKQIRKSRGGKNREGSGKKERKGTKKDKKK